MLLALLLLTNTIFAQDVSTPAAGLASPSAIPTEILIDPLQEKIAQYTKDYNYSKDLYNQAYLVYTNKKQTHTKYGTIITKEEKFRATRAVLIARNTMLKTYLLTLRVRLDKYIAQDPTETEKLKIEISKLEDWLLEQNTIISSLSEGDFQENYEQFKYKYNLYQQIVYAALSQQHINQNLYTKGLILPIILDLETNNLKPEGQQLLSEIKIKLDLSKQSLDKAREYTKQKQTSGRYADFYPDVKQEVNKSRDYLSQIVTNIEGIILRFL